MKTFTSLLLVNRLLTSLFTLTFLLLTIVVSAQSVNNNSLYDASTGIEYASLTASASEKAVFINWVTVSEQNNSHFEVERSLDMKVFKTVAMVLDGFTATGTGKTYKFKEEAGAINKGKTVYYRLKQVSTDNQVSYSTVMAVQRNTTVTAVFPKQHPAIAKLNNSNKVSASAGVQHINPNSQILLSKQSDTGIINLSAEKVKLSAGIFNAGLLMNGDLLMNTILLLA